jgi:hypothetical protein
MTRRFADKLKELSDIQKAKTLTDRSAKMAELEAIQQLADDIGAGGAVIKKIKYFITYSADSKVELNKMERLVKNIISKNKMRINYCLMKQ